jgi:hypothetical protein
LQLNTPMRTGRKQQAETSMLQTIGRPELAIQRTTGMSALAIGDFSDREREQIALAAARCSATAAFFPTVGRALARLRGMPERPLCLLVSADLNVRQLVDSVRDDAKLFALPLLVLLPRASSSGYRDAYLAGADDVLVTSDDGGLTRRLANLLLDRRDGRPAPVLGRTTIVSSDEVSRRRLGRTLRQVGFDVSYAASLDEVIAAVGTPDAPLFVVTTEQPSASLAASELPIMFVTREDMAAAMTRTGDQVVDLTGRLLFFADEQAKTRFKDRRSSARKLCATVCQFREAGSLQPTFGLTHNVSRDGMYVRTIDPPRPNSVVWLELSAPGLDTPVHLRARVMWQRLPGAGTGVLPPGFGLKLEASECPPRDLEAYIRGCDALPG